MPKKSVANLFAAAGPATGGGSAETTSPRPPDDAPNMPSWIHSPDDVFSFFDREKDNCLNKHEFGLAIRACGGCPSQKQITAFWRTMAEEEDAAEVAKKGGASGRLGIKRQMFVDNIPRILEEAPLPPRARIMEALRTFTKYADDQQGKILELDTMKMVLGGMGPEHLGPLEVEAALAGLEHKPGQIHMGKFVDAITGQNKFKTAFTNTTPEQTKAGSELRKSIRKSIMAMEFGKSPSEGRKSLFPAMAPEGGTAASEGRKSTAVSVSFAPSS